MEDSIRQLASIQVIKELNPIEGADRIEVATVLGWKLVVKKGEFKVGDLCVYFEIDSVLPKKEWSEFLVDKNRPDKPIRLKTVRLRGQISQGLAMPVSILDEYDLGHYQEDMDVTGILGVEKYEPPIPAQLAGQMKGTFPSFLIKTDSHRLQAYPRLIEEMQGIECYASIKIDGTSSTFYKREGEFGVCSRNMDLIRVEGNTYWEMVDKYLIEENLPDWYSIQGETYGEGIQGNRLEVKGHHLAIFDAFNINAYRYSNLSELRNLCSELNLPMVDIVHEGLFKWNSIDELMEFTAEQEYPNGAKAEGIVIRPVIEQESKSLKGGRMAFKVISPYYLEKYGE